MGGRGRKKREGKRGKRRGANDQHQFFSSHPVNYIERELCTADCCAHVLNSRSKPHTERFEYNYFV